MSVEKSLHIDEVLFGPFSLGLNQNQARHGVQPRGLSHGAVILCFDNQAAFFAALFCFAHLARGRMRRTPMPMTRLSTQKMRGMNLVLVARDVPPKNSTRENWSSLVD